MITHCDPSELPEASVSDLPEDHCLCAFCPKCFHVVDATCPECGGLVEPEGAVEKCEGRSAKGEVQNMGGTSYLTRGEFYRRFIVLIQSARNSKFTLGCYLIATGDAFADGVSMNEFARKWGIKKATVSKQCRFICHYLGIPPSQYMRKEETARKFRLANRRPRKF